MTSASGPLYTNDQPRGRPRQSAGTEKRDSNMTIPYGTPVSPKMERVLDSV